MADRAIKSDDNLPKGVVDLNNDDRWQARLAEARARREIALREKASGVVEAKRRLKPWEDEASEDPDTFQIEPLIRTKVSDEKRLDFADRVDVMREAALIEDDGTEPALKSVQKPKIVTQPAVHEPVNAKTPFDEIVTSVPAAPKFVDAPRDTLVADDAPDIEALAARYGASLSPRPIEPSVDEPELGLEYPDLAAEKNVAKPIRRLRPRGLAMVLIALAALPLTTYAPPLSKGPRMQSAPSFGLVPALGLTGAMLWQPAPTSSGEWAPVTIIPPVGPLQDWTQAPAEFERLIGGFPKQTAKAILDGEISVSAFERVAYLSAPSKLHVPEGVVSPIASTSSPNALSTPKPRPMPPDRKTDILAPDIRPSPLRSSSGQIPEPLVRPRADAKVLLNASPVGVPATRTQEVSTSPLSVTILVPASANEKIAQALAFDAMRRGHSVAHVRAVNISIKTRNLRFFHRADRTEAAILAEAYGATLKDFSWFSPKPEVGTTELWLSGRSNVSARPTRRATVRDSLLSAAPNIVIIRKPGLLGRLFGGLRGEELSGASRVNNSVAPVTVPLVPSRSVNAGSTVADGSEVDGQ